MLECSCNGLCLIEWKLLKSPFEMRFKAVMLPDKDVWTPTSGKSSPPSDKNMSTETTSSCNSALDLTEMNTIDIPEQIWKGYFYVANFLGCSAVQ